MRGLPSFADRPPPRRRDPEPHHLDRLATSHHRLALCYREPAPDKAGEHPTADTMAADEQLLIDVMAAAREQLQRPLLFRDYADYRHRPVPPGNRCPPNRSANACASSGLVKQNTTKSLSSRR